MKFIGWQTRRKQSFLDKYPQSSEFAVMVYAEEREARMAGLSTEEMVDGTFPQELLDAVIIRPVYAGDPVEERVQGARV